MANQKGTHAYEFERFATAPQAQQPVRQPKRRRTGPAQPRLVPPPRQTKAQQQAQARANNRRIAKIMLISLLCLAMASSLMYLRVQITEITQEKTKVQQRLAEQQSEYVRLEMQLASRISLDRVEKIAIEKLGMVPYRDEYYPISVPQTDGVQSYVGNPDS